MEKQKYLTNLMTDQDYKKIEDLDALLKNDPHNVALIVQKGFIFYDNFADDLAVEVFKHAIHVDPYYVDAYFWLATCLYFHIGEYKQAEHFALEGLKISPQREDLINLLAKIRDSLERWKMTPQEIEAEQLRNKKK